MSVVSEGVKTQTNKTKQSESYINGVRNPIKLSASFGNPLQISMFFFSPPFLLVFISSFSRQLVVFVCDRVEKQVNVCSGCAISDPIDLIQQGGEVEI